MFVFSDLEQRDIKDFPIELPLDVGVFTFLCMLFSTVDKVLVTEAG